MLIDLPREVLLLFTWHHGGVAHRTTWLDQLKEAWPGWEIRWAYGGVEDVAAYVGVDRKHVRTEREPIERLVNDHLLDYPDDGDFVITIREGGTLRGYSACAQHCDLPWAGPKLIDLARGLTPTPGRGRYSESDTGPESGVHIDVDQREIGVWTVAPILGTVEELAACWPGWTFEFWEDRHTEQTRRCGEDFPMFPW